MPAALKASLLFSALADYAISRHWQYVYPVWSRRAQGISLGINLHPNHCCNWHCVYCQVSGLKRGPSPVIALGTLQVELEDCLDWISGWTAAHGEGPRRSLVQDVAFAGDGEPTTSPQFAEAMLLVIQTLNQRPPEHRPQRIRLITNGSQLQHAQVQRAISLLQAAGGEVWFKLDAGNDAEMLAVNDSHLPLTLHLQRLEICCSLCPTWIQTAVLSWRVDGQVITTPTLDDYVQVLDPLKHQVKGILLYGIARPSQQATADCIGPVSEELLDRYAEKLRAQGYSVRAFC